MKQSFMIVVPAVTRYNVETSRREVIKPECTAHISVEVDFEKIAYRLGVKAALSKSRKSIDVGGLVQVRATQVKAAPRGA